MSKTSGTFRVMLKQVVRFCDVAVVLFALCVAAQPALAQNRCLVPLDGYLNTLPAFNAPDLKNVANSLREQGALHLQLARECRLGISQIPGYEQQLQGFSNSGREALANHARQDGQPDEGTCNPLAGSQAMAWAATRMGVAFNTWAINTIHCVAGDNNLAPIPQFCPYAVQTNMPATNSFSRDDPKVFESSVRGG
jgi:hypothetical protein